MADRFYTYEEQERGRWCVADRTEPFSRTYKLCEPGVICKTGSKAKADLIAGALNAVSGKGGDNG